jgi:hypothetical protein
MDVVKALNSVDGPQWKTSLFGNPTDPETLRFVPLFSFEGKISFN